MARCSRWREDWVPEEPGPERGEGPFERNEEARPLERGCGEPVQEPRFVTCPHCRKRVREDAHKCHRCGRRFLGMALMDCVEEHRRRRFVAVTGLLAAAVLALGTAWLCLT